MAEVGRPVVKALDQAGLLRPAFLYLRILLSPEGPLLRDLTWGLDDLHAAVTLPRWQGDLAGTLAAAASGRMEEAPPQWRPGVTVAVAMVAESYPGPAPEGQELRGLYEAQGLIFHQATRLSGGNALPTNPLSSLLRPVSAASPAGLARPVLTAGGRVLLVAGHAPTGAAARRKVYETLAQIEFTHCAWRNDIAAEIE